MINRAGLVLVACMGVPALASAQGAWAVGLTPTMNPLPIGSCAAIHLTVLDPAVRDAPRNPLGRRVTMADFDVDVTTLDGTSARAQHMDAYHISACGCQRAAPGTVVNITATYPARALEPSARVPGVSVQRTATFALAPAKGTFNPPECERPAPPPVRQASAAAQAGTSAVRTVTTKTLSLAGTEAGGTTPIRTSNPARTSAVRTITTKTVILAGGN